MSTWLIYALLSALSASLVAIFGKIGLQHLDANTATAVRAVVMALFLVGVVVIQGKFNLVGTVLADKKALLFVGTQWCCRCIILAILFYGDQKRECLASGPD